MFNFVSSIATALFDSSDFSCENWILVLDTSACRHDKLSHAYTWKCIKLFGYDGDADNTTFDMDESKHLRLDSWAPADAAVVCVVCMNHLNIKLSRNLAHIRSFRPINLPLLLGSPLVVVSSNVNLTPSPLVSFNLSHGIVVGLYSLVFPSVAALYARVFVCLSIRKKTNIFLQYLPFLGQLRRRRMAARFSRLTQQIVDRRENRRKTLATES